MSTSNCFDITNASVTVCKQVYAHDHNSTENKINHDKQIIFFEDTEEKGQKLSFMFNKSVIRKN